MEEEGKPAFTPLVVNFLADILVNARLVQHGEKSEGIVTDWRDQAMVRSRWTRLLERLRLRSKDAKVFNDYFVIFIMVQLELFADPASSQLLAPFLSATPEMTEAIRQLRSYYTEPAVTDDPTVWPGLFKRGAQIIAPFLPAQPPLKMPSFPNPWLNPRSPEEAQRRSSPAWFDEEREEVVPMPGRILLPDATTQPVPTGRFGRMIRPGMTRGTGSSAGGNTDGARVVLPPHLVGRVRALDFYYRSLAKNVSVRAKPRVPKPTHTALLNLMPTEAALKIVEGSAQELTHVAFAIDVSPSMLEGGDPLDVAGVQTAWGEDSPYHHALVTSQVERFLSGW